MPMRREAYPAGRNAISLATVTAGGCKFCAAENAKAHPITRSIVVLTVAHLLDPKRMNCADENLEALCSPDAKGPAPTPADRRCGRGLCAGGGRREARVKG
jgi:hypothetical protein